MPVSMLRGLSTAASLHNGPTPALRVFLNWPRKTKTGTDSPLLLTSVIPKGGREKGR